MINSKNLLVAEAAATPKQDTKAILKTIKVEKGRTIGTNGHILVQISRLPFEENEQEHEFYIPVEIAKKIKLKKENNLIFDQDEKYTTITLPDGTTAKMVNPEERYPNIDVCYPKYENPITITLDAKLLKTVCDIVIKFKENTSWVTFTIEGNDPNPLLPIQFNTNNSEQTLSGLIMPIRNLK